MLESMSYATYKDFLFQESEILYKEQNIWRISLTNQHDDITDFKY